MFTKGSRSPVSEPSIANYLTSRTSRTKRRIPIYHQAATHELTPKSPSRFTATLKPKKKRPKFGKELTRDPKGAFMTACIVGWAHTPFGKLTGETVESLIVKVAGEALTDAGVEPPISIRSWSAISTRVSRHRISPPRSRSRPCPKCASSPRHGWRMPAPRACGGP